MSLQEAVDYLLSLIGELRGGRFDLAKIEALVSRLGHPERSFRTVHIAGTNGKGSTAAMIEAGLRAAGYSTGLFTSPHLSRFNERIRIGGEEINDTGFVQAVDEVRRAAERQTAEEGRRMQPSFFEAITAAACCAFRHAGVEWGVFEVGLGGRLDATNALTPEAAVITRIAFDHESWLGKSAEAIAAEKAGILKPGAVAVFARQEERAAAVLTARAAEVKAPVIWAHKRWQADDLCADDRGRFSFRARGPRGLADIRLRLAGEHQVENAITAIAALEQVGVPVQAIERGLAETRWPGRLELFPGQPEILFDAAHNPSGARTLARHLERFYQGRPIHLIFGVSRDKAVEETAGALFPAVERVTLTRSRIARAASPEGIERIVDHLHGRIGRAATPEEAFTIAQGATPPGGLIVVAGSIFLVGEIRDLLLQKVSRAS